jgi:UDP:flavonoid glycosyltransferase YjiC (YdhE family)
VHALLVSIGSHGDVHPFVALGLALKARGHQVTLITNEHFADLAARSGLDFVPLGTDAEFRQAIENPLLWDPMEGFRLVMRWAIELMEPLYQLLIERYVPGETVVAAPLTGFGARVAQEARGIPLVSVHLQPAVFRSAIQPAVLPYYHLIKWLPVWGRRALFRVLDALVIDPGIGPPINAFRAKLGLPRARRFFNWWNSPTSVLGLFPDWFGPPQPDWPPHVTLTGFPLFDESAHSAADPEVLAFLRAGDPPVVFTAGSAMQHASEFFRAAVEACTSTGRRAILLARFADQIPSNLPDTIRHFSYVPFSRLLPHAAVLVHHGGIGTTAQALAAGLPQLVMPLAHDQPDNAARLERLGVGRSLPPAQFNGPAVARALHELLDDPEVGPRARLLAERLDPERALEHASVVLESAVGSPCPTADPPPASSVAPHPRTSS